MRKCSYFRAKRMYLRTVGRRFTQMIAYFVVMNSKRCNNQKKKKKPQKTHRSKNFRMSDLLLKLNDIFRRFSCKSVHKAFNCNPAPR